MEMDRLIAELGDTALADGLGPEGLRWIAEAGEVREEPAGALLREEGESHAGLIVVLRGEVDVLKSDGDGEPHCLVSLAEQSILGEVSLILGKPAGATVRTRRPSTIFVLDRDRFKELLAGGDRTAASLTLSLAKILAGRLQAMNEEAIHLCERYEEALAQAGTSQGSEQVQELANFRQKLLTEWNF